MSLETYRKSGQGVETPVWVAGDPDDDRLYVYTNRTSWKVKRIRANPKVRIAPCTASGRVTGSWTEATARVIDDPKEQERGFDAVIAKYGLQMRAVLLFSRLGGRYADRTIVELRLGP